MKRNTIAVVGRKKLLETKRMHRRINVNAQKNNAIARVRERLDSKTQNTNKTMQIENAANIDTANNEESRYHSREETRQQQMEWETGRKDAEKRQQEVNRCAEEASFIPSNPRAIWIPWLAANYETDRIHRHTPRRLNRDKISKQIARNDKHTHLGSKTKRTNKTRQHK